MVLVTGNPPPETWTLPTLVWPDCWVSFSAVVVPSGAVVASAVTVDLSFCQ